MASRLWKNEEACMEAIERSLKGIEIIQNQYWNNLLDPGVADAIGSSLYKHFRSFCEGMLYLVCCMKADINGTRDFPRLKDLLSQGDLIDAPIEAILAANGICDLKKHFDKGLISLGMIKLLLDAVKKYMDWAWSELYYYEDYKSEGYGRLKDIEQIYKKIMRKFEESYASYN